MATALRSQVCGVAEMLAVFGAARSVAFECRESSWRRLVQVVSGRANPSGLILADLKERFDEQAAAPAFDRLYDDAEFGHMFAVLHRRLNSHFDDINGRAKTTRHYWAENSRDLLALIEEINQIRHDLRRAGVEVVLDERYQQALEKCEPWLSPSGGSPVPDDFAQIEVVTYEPVFTRPSTTVQLKKQQSPVELKMVGEGSYATVHSYVDPDYGIKFAVKRAKRGIDERDLHRFKQEFEVMNRLSFPYVLEVYQYNDERSEYRMEFCDETLRGYIAKRNGTLTFSSRKRVALQLLYGINYIHGQGLLHRDISLQNVLLKVYAGGAVLVKLSDFGLVKDATCNCSGPRRGALNVARVVGMLLGSVRLHLPPLAGSRARVVGSRCSHRGAAVGDAR